MRFVMTVSRSQGSLDGLEGEVGPEPSGMESMARISVSLPRSLYRQFRLHALEQDTTLSALVARLIRQEISGSN